MALFYAEFPYEEIREKHTEDYFSTANQAWRETGYSLDHIWAISEEDGVWIYGPSHHYVNVVGYIATNEAHDDQTYFVEQTQVAEMQREKESYQL